MTPWHAFAAWSDALKASERAHPAITTWFYAALAMVMLAFAISAISSPIRQKRFVVAAWIAMAFSCALTAILGP